MVECGANFYVYADKSQNIMSDGFFLSFFLGADKLYFAAVILPVVQKQHQLLVTLLLCNACAMEVQFFDLVSSSNSSLTIYPCYINLNMQCIQLLLYLRLR